MPLLHHYKSFVKQHPSLVLNLERLLHWVAWNPERFSGSEFAYEAFNSAVGLLGIYNESILAEHPDYNATVAKYALWLAAVQQVETLVELRAIQLEQRGKMSRYGPLVVLEAIKTLLRLQLWRSSKCSLALESVTREDTEHHECEQQLKDLLQALCCLRHKYCSETCDKPTPEQQQYTEELTRQQIVRAAAIAPHRPPAACAVAGMMRAGSLGRSGSLGSSGAVNGSSSSSSSSDGRCLTCGTVSQKPSVTVDGVAAAQQQQQQRCQSCGEPLHHHQQIQQQTHSSKGYVPGLSEIVPAEQQPPSSRYSSSSSSSSSRLKGGWWQRVTSLYPAGRSSSSSKAAKPQQQQQQQHVVGVSAGPGALRGNSWGPAHTLPSPAAATSSSKLFSSSSCCRDLHRSSSSSKGCSFFWQLQRQHLQQLPWCLCNRDVSIGHSVMWLGELIYVIRPLIYVSLLRQYGIMSWKPWMLSLALDLASGYGLHTGQAILGHSNASRWPGGSTLYSLALLRSLSSSKWSPGEQQELVARRVALLRYLLRSPCYNTVTRRVLQKVVTGSSWIPGVSSLTDFAFNMIEGMQGLYSYVES